MKFKNGDKVRILPSAIDGGVLACSVGKIGIVDGIADSYSGSYYHVCMVSGYTWSVYPNQIESVIVKKGEQLLFSFMEEK